MKVLIAEDDTVSRRILETLLRKWGYEIVVTTDGFEAWEALQAEDAPKLAVLDWMMPGMDGVDICRSIREQAKEPYTYIILLTSNVEMDRLVIGMEAGADDFITKPYNPEELKVRLRAGVRITGLQEDLLSAKKALSIKAARDSLTGLLNHNEIFTVLTRELTRAKRDASEVTVIMADLDKFKDINDTYGHLTGDAVLCEAAGKIQHLMRPSDSIGRYGGEEFLVVLPGCDEHIGASVAERIRESFDNKAIATTTGEIAVKVSLGVASARRICSYETKELIHAADTALYHAKNEGRNRVKVSEGICEVNRPVKAS